MLVEGLAGGARARGLRSCAPRSRRPGPRASGRSAPARRRAGRCTRRRRRCSQPTFVPVRPWSRMKSDEQRARLGLAPRSGAPLMRSLTRGPHSTSARRVTSAISARRWPPVDRLGGELRGLARAGALAQRVLGARRPRPTPSTATAACPGASTTAAAARRRRRRAVRAYSAKAVRAPGGSGGSTTLGSTQRALLARSIRVEREQRRAASCARGIGVGRRARPSPDVPRERVAGWPTCADGLREQRPVRARPAASARARPGGRWRRAAAPVGAADHAEAGAVDVDEPRRPLAAGVEQRDEALPAGEHPRAVVAQRLQRLLDRVGGDVLERRGLHAPRRDQPRGAAPRLWLDAARERAVERTRDRPPRASGSPAARVQAGRRSTASSAPVTRSPDRRADAVDAERGRVGVVVGLLEHDRARAASRRRRQQPRSCSQRHCSARQTFSAVNGGSRWRRRARRRARWRSPRACRSRRPRRCP